MGEQDAGAVAIQVGLPEDRPEAQSIDRVTMVHSNDLQAIDFQLLVVEDANARAFCSVEVLLVVGELLVISGNKERSLRS